MPVAITRSASFTIFCVDPGTPYGGYRSEVGPLARIAAVGVDDAHAVDDSAELLALLGIGRRAVQPDGDDHRDALVGDTAGVQLVEQRRDEDVVGAMRGSGR